MLITDILENTESLQVIVSDIKTFYETIDENNTKIVYVQRVNYTDSQSINEINSVDIKDEQAFQLPVTI
jgi:hypothetical protein